MLDEVAVTSIHSSSQKGMRAHHPNVSRSRRPSLGAEWKPMLEIGGFRFCPKSDAMTAEG
jgi:hypothetical protein